MESIILGILKISGDLQVASYDYYDDVAKIRFSDGHTLYFKGYVCHWGYVSALGNVWVTNPSETEIFRYEGRINYSLEGFRIVFRNENYSLHTIAKYVEVAEKHFRIECVIKEQGFADVTLRECWKLLRHTDSLLNTIYMEVGRHEKITVAS